MSVTQVQVLIAQLYYYFVILRCQSANRRYLRLWDLYLGERIFRISFRLQLFNRLRFNSLFALLFCWVFSLNHCFGPAFWLSWLFYFNFYPRLYCFNPLAQSQHTYLYWLSLATAFFWWFDNCD